MTDTSAPAAHVTVTAHVTDRWGETTDVYAGTQPAWAWADRDALAPWRRMMRAQLLADAGCSDPRGWRVTYTAEALTDE